MRYLSLLLLLILSGCATCQRLADSPTHTRRTYEHRQRLHQRERAQLRKWKRADAKASHEVSE